MEAFVQDGKSNILGSGSFEIARNELPAHDDDLHEPDFHVRLLRQMSAVDESHLAGH